MFFLNQTSGQYHGGQCHGNTVLKFWEFLLRHHRPCRAARGCHKRNLVGYMVKEINCFLCCAHVRTHCNFNDIGKAKCLHGSAQFLRCYLGAKLTDKCRCHSRINRCALLHGLNHLENLCLICNRTKRAIYQTHTARNTLIIVDFRAAVFIRTNRINTARLCTRAFLLDNRIIRANILATATFNALILVNHRTAIDNVDGILGAHFGARMRQTALTALCNHNALLRARMAGELNNVDERRLIILFDGCALLDSIRNRCICRSCAHRHTHCQAQTLADNCAL